MQRGRRGPGARVYDWALVEIRPLREPGKGYWLLARRSIANPEELAYYVCYGPAGTTLEGLARVAWTRWAIEECFEAAKGQVGLEQYEVRRWDGWYRHITLVMHGPRLPGGNKTSGVGARMLQEKGGCPGLDESLIPMTVPEVRRLLTRLVWTANHPAELVLVPGLYGDDTIRPKPGDVTTNDGCHYWFQ